MQHPVSRCSAIAIALFIPAVVVTDLAAQEARADSLESRVVEIEGRLHQLEARIDSILSALARGVAAAQPEPDTVSELAALRAAAAAAAAPIQEEQERKGAETSRTSALQILNPEITVTGDIVGGYARPSGGSGRASVVPREFEFSFQTALDPYTRMKVFLTHEEDVEIAGVPEAGGDEGGGFEIEEGYMYWVGLPLGFGAKVGKFRQQIGHYNRWHTHALFEIERPLVTGAFLGEDGLIQTGGGVTLPSLSAGASTNTATLEVAAGSNDALFDAGNQLTFLGNLQSFWDLGAASYLQFGATGVTGKNDDVSLRRTQLLGLDVSYRWRPPSQARYRDLNLKAEWYFARKDFDLEELTGKGGYLQANYRLGQSWDVGARVDYLDGYGDDPKLFQFVPTLTWWQSEWVRLRLQYNYLRPEGGGDSHTLLLQAVWAAGPDKHETY